MPVVDFWKVDAPTKLWSDPDNWSKGVPLSTYDVMLQGEGQVVVDGNVKVQSINFRGNKVQLTINGTLELQQTISNTSSLIPAGSTVFLNGTLQIDAGTTLTWQGKSLTEPPPLGEYSGGRSRCPAQCLGISIAE